MKETVTQDDDVWKNQSFMVTDSVLIKSQDLIVTEEISFTVY
jgi:hypothetical protein